VKDIICAAARLPVYRNDVTREKALADPTGAEAHAARPP